MSLLCMVGFHRWHYGTYRDWPKRYCLRCNTAQEAAYDMSYGCTWWRKP